MSKVVVKPEVLAYIFSKHNYRIKASIFFSRQQLNSFVKNFCGFMISNGYQPVDENDRALIEDSQAAKEMSKNIIKVWAMPIDEQKVPDIYYFMSEDLKVMRSEFNKKPIAIQSCIVKFEMALTKAEWSSSEQFDMFEEFYSEDLNSVLKKNNLRSNNVDEKIYSA